MPDFLSKIDQMINSLEGAMEDASVLDFSVSAGEPPRSATFRVTQGSYISVSEKKPKPSEVYIIKDQKVMMRSRGDVAKGSEIELTLQMRKDGRGETFFVMRCEVTKTLRVSGAYEINANIISQQKTEIPSHRRFLECVAEKDSLAWNRWCATLEEGAVLKSLDLVGAGLANFDLSCADLSESNLENADLSGADLSGANLDACNLDGVKVSGTDLYLARLPRRYMGLILASGTVEAESVALV